MNNLLLMKQLKFGGTAIETVVVKNTSGGALTEGDVVILDTANSTATLTAVTTTSTQDDLLVFGMLFEAIANGEYGRCLVKGLTSKLKVNGTTNVDVGDHLSCYSSAGIAGEATIGKGGAFAIALEAYATNDSSGVIDAYLTGSAGRFDSSSVTSAGALTYTEATAPAGTLCYIVRDNTGDLTANAITGKSIHLAIAGTDEYDFTAAGMDLKTNTLTGSGLWTPAGGIALADQKLDITTGYIEIGDTNPAGAGSIRIANNTYLGAARNAASDANVNLIKINASDLTEFGANLAAHTVAGALVVSTGGIAVTGVSSITGATTITGTLVVTGDVSWGGTFTVDELILDSDGAAPAAAFVYLVSDNTGDMTLNALSGKEVHVAIAGNDEYDFNATAFQLASANNIQFLGDNGILDSAGNEVIIVEAIGSAVNYLNVKNAATADPIILECKGTVDRGFIFVTQEDEEMLTLEPVASALYNFKLLSAASGGKPTIQSEGAVDIGIDFETSEGEELLTLTPVATAIYNFNMISAASGGVPTLQTAGAADIGMTFETSESEEMLELVPVATAIYNIVITSAATGTKPIIATSTADIGIMFTEGSAEEMLVLENIATAVDYVNIKSGDGTTHPTISVAGDTAAIDLLLTAKGTGAIVLNNGTDPVVIKFMGAQAGYNNEIQDVNGNEIIALQGVASAVCEIGISNAVASSPAIIKAQGEINSNLMIDTSGTGMITIALGGDEVLGIHDAAVTLTAANDTAGHAIYLKTEKGGTDTGATGKAGGLLHLSTGDGSASATATAVGGAGGALSIVTGTGGTGLTTGAGGAGGALALAGGTGGAGADAAAIGGAGGAITLTTGIGGASGGATGTGGVGGNLTLAASAGGAGTGGTGGNGGNITLTAGAAGAAGGGTAGKAGVIRNMSRVLEDRSITAKTDTITITAAELLTGVITGDPTAPATYTLPTAALLVAEIPGCQIGDSFFFVVNNIDAALTITVAAGANGTGDGTLSVAPNVIRQFFVLITAVAGDGSYALYGLGA